MLAADLATPSLPGIITAIATVITALGVFVVALTGFVKVLAALRTTTKKVDEAAAKVEDVHKIVNQQRTDMQRYEAALIKALHAAGVEVPDDQSKQEPHP